MTVIDPEEPAPCVGCGTPLETWKIIEGIQFRKLKHFVMTPPPGVPAGPYCWPCQQVVKQGGDPRTGGRSSKP